MICRLALQFRLVIFLDDHVHLLIHVVAIVHTLVHSGLTDARASKLSALSLELLGANLLVGLVVCDLVTLEKLIDN